MQISDVEDYLLRIKQARSDGEHAHSLEDELFQKLVEEAATQRTRIGALARLALKSKKLHFHRWYA